MKIGIYDVDSKIPNLALMRLSAYHKERGDRVEAYSPLFKDHYDHIYASRLFNFSDASLLEPERMEIGGTGWDLKKSLPSEVENLMKKLFWMVAIIIACWLYWSFQLGGAYRDVQRERQYQSQPNGKWPPCVMGANGLPVNTPCVGPERRGE